MMTIRNRLLARAPMLSGLVAAVLLCCSLPAQATTVSGTVKLPDGTLVNGTIEFILSQQATTITPPVLFAPVKTTCAISAGAITSCTVQGNDTLEPAGTFYKVRIVDQRNIILMPETKYTIAGASVDLGTLPPTATATLVPPTGSVVGNMNVTGNLTVGGSMTAAGSTTQVQFNNAGVMAGDPEFTFNPATNTLTIDTQTVDKLDGIRVVRSGGKFPTIATALTDLPTDVIAGGDSFKHGTIYLPYLAAGYTVASTLTISPFVKIVGEGMEPIVINCPAGTTCINYNNVPFSVQISDGGLYNVTLKGDGSANQIGLQGTDATGLVLQNVRISGFSGTGAIGANLSHTTGFTERTNFNRVWWSNNTTSLKLNGGTINSFGHQHWTDLQFNLSVAGQTAIAMTGNAFLYSSVISGVINSDHTSGVATAFNLAGTSVVNSTVFMNLLVDIVQAGTVTGVSSVAGTTFAAGGNFSGYTSNATSGTFYQSLPGGRGGGTFVGDFLFPPASVGLATTSSGPTGLGVWLMPALGVGGNFYQGIGWNGFFDGTNWKTVGDTVNNGGALILQVQGPNSALRFYTIPATGGSAQTISPATLDSTHLRGTWDVAGLHAKRYFADRGTPLVAGDFALSAGWGTTATLTSVRGTDQFFEFVVTSAGTGQGANPTITHTPKDGTWTTAPIWDCVRKDFGSQATATFTHTTQTATSLVLTLNGTPVAAETFKIGCHTGGV